jgi:hypothetical protein
MTPMKNRLYEWYERVAETICAMPEDAIERMNAWRDEHPEQSDADWPEVLAIVGPRPKRSPVLRIERSA